jgi:hypothetical protein
MTGASSVLRNTARLLKGPLSERESAVGGGGRPLSQALEPGPGKLFAAEVSLLKSQKSKIAG